jgi:hypothetical protein
MIQIPREQMPQIDEKDIPRLLVWLGSQGVGLSAGHCSAEGLQFHQAVILEKVHAMSSDLMAKPILISEDHGVLDGNHRGARHVIEKLPCPFIRLHTDFSHAINLLKAFPYSYELTSTTPERN